MELTFHESDRTMSTAGARQLKRNHEDFAGHHQHHQQSPHMVEVRCGAQPHNTKRYRSTNYRLPASPLNLPTPSARVNEWPSASTGTPAYVTATPPCETLSPLQNPFFASAQAHAPTTHSPHLVPDDEDHDMHMDVDPSHAHVHAHPPQPEMPPSPVSDAGDDGVEHHGDVEMAPSSPQPVRRPLVSGVAKTLPGFRMGFRDDCDKCRNRVVGHFGHLDGRWQVPARP